MVDCAAAWLPGDAGIKPVKDAGPKVWLCHIERSEDAGPAPIIRIHPARGVVGSTI
jgi:hypothetical protein